MCLPVDYSTTNDVRFVFVMRCLSFDAVLPWCAIIKSGQRILTKGSIARRAIIEKWMIPFAANITAETANAFEWAGQPTSPKSSLAWGISTHLIHGSRTQPTWISPAPKRHLDRFNNFCRAHKRVQQTDGQTHTHTHTHTQTDLVTPCVVIARILCNACDAA